MIRKNRSKSSPVGIFDSGAGGLTVASAVKQLLPHESIIYFGDTAHLPYGDKSAEAILHYSRKITDFLLGHGCKIILAACNTVSATVWDNLNRYISGKAIPVNVIDPVVENVVRLYPGSFISIIGTKNTVNSLAYPEKIKKLSPGAKVSSLATPLLVPMIEEGFINDDISSAIINAYLSDPKLKGTETLILGCTHYPIIRDQIIDYYENKVEVIDSAMIVATRLKEILESNDMLNESSYVTDRFCVSDHTEYFGKIAAMFFHDQIRVEKIDLWR